MKILRWLLCHLLSITLLVSLVTIFLFRDVLKEDFYRLTGMSSHSAKVEEVSATQDIGSREATPAVASDFTQNQPAGSPQGHAEPTASQDNRVNVENRFTENNQPATADYKGASQQSDNSSDPWDNVLAGPVDETKAMNSVGGEGRLTAKESIFPPENYDPEENEPGSATVDNTAGRNEGDPNTLKSTTETSPQPGPLSKQAGVSPAGASSSETSKYFQILEDTRQLYWSGKSGPAQAAYEKLMFEYPEQPEAPAELGNLFLQQGNRKAASWAYQNAIPRYLNLHREQEAINLMRFISQYDPAIADSLQKKYW